MNVETVGQVEMFECRRVNTFKLILSYSDKISERLVTVDETWFHHHYNNTTIILRPNISPCNGSTWVFWCRRKSKSQKSAGKVMATVY